MLFIMAEKNVYADAIGGYLLKTKDFRFKETEVLVIHTDAAGEITKKDLDKAREAARDIDKAESKVKAIVSVMMLREGWDVRNVTVVLGLRPFTARAEILPEQVIGRGLRLMTQVSPDRTQTLEVLGTRNLLNVLRSQLEAEGVGVASTKIDPMPPVIISPIKERLAYDIAIPITKPSLEHDIRKLSELEVEALDAIYEQEDLAEVFRIESSSSSSRPLRQRSIRPTSRRTSWHLRLSCLPASPTRSSTVPSCRIGSRSSIPRCGATSRPAASAELRILRTRPSFPTFPGWSCRMASLSISPARSLS